MGAISLRRVEKTYGHGPKAVKVIHGVDAEIADGEFIVIVGPSGCGKSTLLRMVAGLEEITGGEIAIGARVVNRLEPAERDIAMVFQNYALYPHMSVYDNMAYGLKIARLPKAEIDQRVHKAAKILELSALLERRPRQLSGGQRQRVAMGRAIVRQPQVFLFDEPLSNLDAKLRVQTRLEIQGLHRELGITSLFVTHDQVEAMTMGDRVAVIKDGVLQQVDTPQTLYDHPTNVFVAAFIGSPSMNLFETVFTADADGDGSMTVGSQTLSVPASFIDSRPGLRARSGQTLVAGIRPEDLYDAELRTDHASDQCLNAQIQLIEALGADALAHFELDAPKVDSGDPDAVDEFGRHASFIARLDPRTRVRAGTDARIAVDIERFHFFDAQTHLTLAEA